MPRPSARQKQDAILDFIKREVRVRGYPPSVREIGDAVGLNSTSTVHSHLEKLEKRGLIRRDPTKPRAIEVIDGTDPRANLRAGTVPLVGKVTAGKPITAIEDIEDYVPLPAALSQDPSLFALKVRGDSMVDAGILDGDIVYVRRQATAQNGDIVVALTDEDEATVKRFFRDLDHVILRPENKSMAPILLKRVTILGKVVGLSRVW